MEAGNDAMASALPEDWKTGTFLGRAITAFRSPLLCVASEFDQLCFLWVKCQAELGKPLAQGGQALSGVRFLVESDHKVVCVAHDGDFTFGMACPPVMDPQVQHVV